MIKFKNLELCNAPRIAVSCIDTSDYNAQDLQQIGIDIVEIRIDQFQSFEPDYIQAKITPFIAMPNIATIRSYAEDKQSLWRQDEHERFNLFLSILSEVDAIDIELRTKFAQELIKQAKQNNTHSIVSYHNFEQTPSLLTLENIIIQAKDMGGDIVKIATQVNTQDDLRTLSILTATHYDKNLIIIGMGQLGKITRISLLSLGSLLTFSCLDTQTALGQINYQKTKKILNQLYP